ncbi:lysostaphin resistance A-like protein [Enterococcus sp. LJL99]
MLEIRITKFQTKLPWIILSVVLPVTVILLTLLFVPGKFSYNSYSIDKVFQIIMYGLFSMGLSAGIVEEFIFRGLIMSTVSDNYSKLIGILIPSILFGLLHLLNGQLSISSFVMLLLGGSLVGILFSLLTYINQTVWASIVTHSLWNFFIIGGLINFGCSNDSNSLTNYIFSKKNLFLTGGDFWHRSIWYCHNMLFDYHCIFAV